MMKKGSRSYLKEGEANKKCSLVSQHNLTKTLLLQGLTLVTNLNGLGR